jgi:hypothetical protein
MRYFGNIELEPHSHKIHKYAKPFQLRHSNAKPLHTIALSNFPSNVGTYFKRVTYPKQTHGECDTLGILNCILKRRFQQIRKTVPTETFKRKTSPHYCSVQFPPGVIIHWEWEWGSRTRNFYGLLRCATYNIDPLSRIRKPGRQTLINLGMFASPVS